MQNVLNFDPALEKRACDQPITVAAFVIGLGAHESHVAIRGQRQQPLDAPQIEQSLRDRLVINLAIWKIERRVFRAPAYFFAEIDIFNASFLDRLSQWFPAEMLVVAAVRHTASVDEHSYLVAPE